MHTWSQAYNNMPVMEAEDAKEAWYERHILDLRDLGIRLRNYLLLLFKDYQDSHEIVQFVYNESFAQMVLAMDHNYDEFCLRLIGLPNFELFRHLQVFNDVYVQQEYTKLFKQIAMELYVIVQEGANPMQQRAQYFTDAVTLSYIIVVKSFEPGMLNISTNL